jgi:hypothetical protein
MDVKASGSESTLLQWHRLTMMVLEEYELTKKISGADIHLFLKARTLQSIKESHNEGCWLLMD